MPVVLLPAHYLPSFRGVLKAPKQASVSRMLDVSYNPGLRCFIVIAEQEAGDFALPPARVNGEPHDVAHWDYRAAPFFLNEIVGQGVQFDRCRPSSTAFGLGNHLFGFQDFAGILNDGEIDGQVPGGPGVSQDHAQPDEVVICCRRAGTRLATGPDVCDQV